MPDVFEQDELRIRGPLRFDAAIVERARQDAQIQAALKIEAEQRAAQQRQAEARQSEALAIAQAESAAVEKLAALKDLYAQRQEAARQAIEALASVWRIESEIRSGLSNADRALASVEVLIDVTQRAAWRSALRARAGLPQHVYKPDVKLANDAQRAGAAAVVALTASIVGPGFIETPRGDVIRFEF